MTSEETVTIGVGPVDANSARVWIDHHLPNIAVLRARLQDLPFLVPIEVLDHFESLMTEWQKVARDADVFEWRGVLEADAVESMVRYWANLDLLTDAEMDRLGISWAPPQGRGVPPRTGPPRARGRDVSPQTSSI
jgi:hypothetical protein